MSNDEMGGQFKPRPIPTPTSQPFWDALARDELHLQRCDECELWIYYPRHRCPRCLSDRLTWRPCSGTGTIHTFTVAPVPTAPPFADEIPQIIAVVELDEGVRLTTTLVDAEVDRIKVGLPVAAVYDHGSDGRTLLRFRPV